MSAGSRILVAAFGDAGHAFPAVALGLGLRDAGHDVVLETWERWRDAVEDAGLRFQAAEAYKVFPPPPPGTEPGPAEAAEALAPLFDEFQPDLVVSDILTLAPSLAAEVRGVAHATLIPHLYPVHQPAMPFFGFGAMPPRTALARRVWSGASPLLETGLRRGRRELNETRAAVGLPPRDRFHGGMSDELVLVATYPELEYPRDWPEEVRLTGPLTFEIPHPDIDLPPGDEPLVLVASSTAHDPDCHLIRDAFAALAREPVRVVATSNGHFPPDPIEVPANGMLVGWLSYSQLMPAADLVICHGGHGTICRALEAGTSLLVSPAVGDMAENGARVQWAGAGLTLPSRLRSAMTLKWCVTELLSNPSYAERAKAVGGRPGASDGAARAVAEVEKLLKR